MTRPPAPDEALAAVSEAELTRQAIDADRLRLFNRQVVRVPVGVIFVAGFIGYMMAPHVGPGLAWGWFGLAVAIWVLRAIVSAVLLVRPAPAQRLRAWIGFLTVLATASGVVGGASAVIFFRAPPLEWAMLTMVVCAWSAAGIAISVALPGAFYGLATCFLVPLALGWVISDMPLRLPVAGLILFFLFYLIVFARDASRLLERALRVGFEKDELARQLRQREAEAQEARARAEAANLAKSRFLASASHDLRQPLHALSLLIDHARHSAVDPALGHTLQQAARSADSLGELFTGLLDLTRLDAGQLAPELRPLPLEGLLRRLDTDFRTLALDKGLGWHRTSADVWVLTDPALLERVLRNLLDNAVKYTESGHIEVRVDAGDRQVRVSVRDTGIGIHRADRERIFDEYYQAHNAARDRRRGIGLGLAIVKRICERLGHAIDVDSTPGAGSCFSVTLQRCEATQAADRSEGSAEAFGRLEGMVLVVIEDDPAICEAMRTLLLGWACRPIIAADSDAAIALLDAVGLAPDALIADWRLAGPENGLQAIQRLCLRYGPRPAAIVTGEIDLAGLEVPPQLSLHVMQKPLRAREIGEWLLHARAMT